ncbi:hypothetical protein LMG8520_2388 [Lactococcus lactis subsp. lactis]|nr:hypothetical protein LMG8520_2388 [Lactococcus lactis subsp. lactis]
MDKDREDDIIETEIEVNVSTLENSKDERNAKERTQNSQRIRDMRDSGHLAGKHDTIVDSDICLIVKSDSAEGVEQTLKEIKKAYKHNSVKGVMFVRRTGEQLNELKNLLTTVRADAWHSADMSTVSASKIFLPSSGFSDEQGVYVGTDISSLLSHNPSIVDFTGVRNAIVFMGGVSVYGSIGGFEGGSLLANGGSAIAHVMADSNYLSGKRTHHIMISKFDYTSPDSLVFDMTKESINTLETFGSVETVQADATANFNKATAVMLLIAKTGSSEEKIKLEAELKDLLVEWVINSANNGGIYTKNPERDPNRARRILATENHKDYPTLYDFLPALNSNVAKRATEGEGPRAVADFLYKTLKTAFNEYPNIFHKETTLPDSFKSNDRNIYYDLSGLENDRKVAGAVFLNTLAYVTNRALNGEQIIIHGLDNVEIPLDEIIPYKEIMERKNIGLITVFNGSEKPINPVSYSAFVGKLSLQDMVILGGLVPDELKDIETKWSRKLPEQVSKTLLESSPNILYFYRRRDRISALIKTHLIL